MDGAVSRNKDQVKQRAGRIGARRRWGEPGVVHLGELTAPQRRLVLALVDAARAEHEKRASVSEPSEALELEVRRGSDERPAA